MGLVGRLILISRVRSGSSPSVKAMLGFNWSIFLLVSRFYGGHYRLRMKLHEKGVGLNDHVGIGIRDRTRSRDGDRRPTKNDLMLRIQMNISAVPGMSLEPSTV